jgi:hypothetical protein
MLLRYIISCLLVLSALMLCGCGGGGRGLNAADAQLRLNVLDESFLDSEPQGSFRLRSTQTADGLEVEVVGSGLRDLRALYFTLSYDALSMHPTAATASGELAATGAGHGVDVLELAVLDDAGTVHHGQLLAGAGTTVGISGEHVLARVTFAIGAASERLTAAAPTSPGSAARLELNGGSLEWRYACSGDTDQNGEVNIADLTPIGQNYLMVGPFDPASDFTLVDADGNGEINLADITPIGANFQRRVEGYKVFSGPAGDYPAGAEVANGPGAALLATVPFGAGTEAQNEVRLFTHTPAAPFSIFWVRPYDGETLGTPSNLLDLEVKLAPEVRVLSSASRDLLTAFETDGTLAFSGTNAELAALAPGEIVVADQSATAPNGLLRRVVSNSGGGAVTLETESVELHEAIEKGRLGFSRGLLEEEVKSSSAATKGVAWIRDKTPSESATGDEFFLGLSGVIAFDADGDSKTKNDQITIDGNCAIEPALDLTFALDGFSVEELSMGIVCDVTANITLKGSYATSWDKEVTLYTWVFTPITIPVGSFPVVLVPKLSLVLGSNGSLTAGFVFSASESAHARAGVGYKDGSWGPFGEFTNDFGFAKPVIYGNVQAKAYAGAKAGIYIYGLAGATGIVNAYLLGSADILADPWWSLCGGIEAKADVNVLGFDYDTTIYDSCKPLISASGGFNGAETPDTWATLLRGSEFDVDYEQLLCILPLPDGGFLAGGETFLEPLLVRYDADGAVVWKRTLVAGQINAIVPAGGGEYIAAGQHFGDGMALRFREDGELVWARSYGGTHTNILRSITPMAFGGYLAAGSFGSEATADDVWLLEIGAGGHLMRSRKFPSPSGDTYVDAVTLADGTIRVAGSYGAGTNVGDALLTRLSPDGTVFWHKVYDNGYSEWATVLTPYGDGCYMAGQTNQGALALWTAQVAADGNPSWVRRVTDGDFALVWEVFDGATTADGGIALVGESGSGIGAGQQDAYALKFTAGGDVAWAWAYGGPKVDFLHGIAERMDGGGLQVVGGTGSFTTDESQDCLAMQLGTNGSVLFDAGSGAQSKALSGSKLDSALTVSTPALVEEHAATAGIPIDEPWVEYDAVTVDIGQ